MSALHVGLSCRGARLHDQHASSERAFDNATSLMGLLKHLKIIISTPQVSTVDLFDIGQSFDWCDQITPETPFGTSFGFSMKPTN